MMLGIKIRVPIASNRIIFAVMDAELSFRALVELLNSNITAMNVTAPIGTLIQKHQRHVSLSVKTPPKGGPAIAAIS